MDYLNLDLLIEPAPPGYRARILASPAGQASGVFAPPTPAPNQEYGAQLYTSLFAGPLHTALHRSLDEAARQGKGLRIRLHLGETPLAALPWESLHDPATHRTFALSAETPIVRYLPLPQPDHPLAVRPPLNILVMVASPSAYPPLDAEKELAQLQTALAAPLQRGLLALHRLEQSTLPALLTRLRQDEIHIFHFIGHGEFNPQTEQGALLLTDEYGDPAPVSGAQLGALLRDERTLRLAVLNACEGARTTHDPFAGVAQRLIQQSIPAAIAMQTNISDRAARTFSQHLYHALANGYPLDAALGEARKGIFAAGNPTEWSIPVLFMRSPSGQLFEMEPTPAKTAPPQPETQPPTPQPLAREQKPYPPARVPIAEPPATGKPASHRPPSDYPHALQDLRKASQRGRLTLYLGADLPATLTGAPARQTLADKFATSHQLPAGQPLAAVAQQIMAHGNRFTFTNFLKQHLLNVQPGLIYRALAQFIDRTTPEWVITTAYHQLLERALENAGNYTLQRVTNDADLSFIDPDAPALLKLYGDIQQTDLIVTEQDENSLLRGRAPNRAGLLTELERLFKRTTLLFIGQDPRDPTLRALFDNAAGGRFQRPAYALWPGLPPAEAKSLESNRGLRVLEVDEAALLGAIAEG